MLMRQEIPQGTLDMLILRILSSRGSLHGFEIASQIQAISRDVLHVEEGSLYPALQRMLMKGWVTAAWGRTAENRRARYYELSKAGSRQLADELARYTQVSAAIGRILKLA